MFISSFYDQNITYRSCSNLRIHLCDALAENAFDQSIPYQQVMPYYFVEKNEVKHYLFLAENDQIVKAKNSLDFKQQLLEQGNHCEIYTIPKTGHISIMGSVSSLFSRFFSTKKQILLALETALKPE